MKTATTKTDSPKLDGTIQLARLRVAAAENRWKAAREQAVLAKRRRQEVKLIARRAKKQAKQAKADLAEARMVLEEAEAKLAKSSGRVTTRKPARAKARPATLGGTVTKIIAPPIRKRRPRSTASSPAHPTVAHAKPASEPVQPGASDLPAAEAQ